MTVCGELSLPVQDGNLKNRKRKKNKKKRRKISQMVKKGIRTIVILCNQRLSDLICDQYIVL